MKKLLYCNQSMGMGGAEVFMADLLAEFQHKKWYVSVVTTRPEFARYLSSHTLSVKQVPFVMDLIGDWKGFVKAFIFGPLSLFQWLFVLLKNISDVKNTTVLVSGFNEKLLVTGLAKLLGFKVVWVQFSALGSILDMWGGFVGFLYANLARKVDGVITSSEYSKKMIVAETANLAKKTTVIPCGRKLKAVNKYKASTTQTLICISRLQPGKGQDLLLEAMPIVLKQFPKVKVHIIGEGDFKQVLERLITKLKLENSVELLGRVADTEQLLEKATISIFPSVWKLEGFGLVLIEAMALAKPIVTFDRPPLNEIIQDTKNGLLAKSGSVQDLAEKIMQLLSNPAQQKKLGLQATQDFRARYTIEKVAAAYGKNLTHYYR